MWQALKERIKLRYSIPSIQSGLMRLRENGFSPRGILDIGAYHGEFAELAATTFPNARVLMIEAQQDSQAVLDKLTLQSGGRLDFAIALLAETDKTVPFYQNATVSSLYPERDGSNFQVRQMRTSTLDSIAGAHPFAPFDLIKLDVQGAELDVLTGGARVLQSAEVVLTEVSLIEVNKNCPLLADVVAYFAANGFRAYDICSFIRRPLDHALWQTDIVFVAEGSSLIGNQAWQ